MVTIDIAGELGRWLSTDEAKQKVADIFRAVMREELKTLLMDDLVDSTRPPRFSA